MSDFDRLLAIAEKNKGNLQELETTMPKVLNPTELASLGDDRFLSMMARCIFRAGFSWKVVNNKWPQFEEVFSKFNPLAIAHFSDEKLEELVGDKRIIRNAIKIKAVRDNAVFILDKQQSHGSYAQWLADWPTAEIVGLWDELKKKGSRLGGSTGPMSLREMGKDTFMLTGDVKAALVNHGLMEKFSPNSKRDLLKVQAVFNQLHNESGKPLSYISRMLAYTIV